MGKERRRLTAYVSSILGQWQSHLATTLAADSDRALLPIDIVDAHLYDVAAAQAQTREQEEYSPVTQPHRRKR